MQQIDGQFVYAASDLNNFLECRHLTELERRVALGLAERPPQDESASLLARKGNEHEHNYLNRLVAEHGEDVVIFEAPAVRTFAGLRAAEEQTIAAMERGARLIYQATFFDGEFLGRPDFLRRVDAPCERWNWSYEVIDTKLAVDSKPYFVIQLCDYSSHLARIQKVMPAYGAIVLGNGEEQRFRLAEFDAYYRHLKEQFLESVAQPEETYPLKCGHCKICPWNTQCERQRASDDHLSLVAWMRRDQIAKFESAGIRTLEALAGADDGGRPSGMNEATFAKLRRQAAMQLRGRREGRPSFELIVQDPGLGFGLLPEPAAGDVFFDMEGDPFYEPGRGLEYLFGVWLPDETQHFKAFRGLDRAGEKRAFEDFIDFVVERRERYPKLHVYHYANYEKAALRRLAQEHCTRESELDDLLRGEVLVDLFAVVRQALVISEDGYGLKRLERFYALQRETDVRRGDASVIMFERWRDDPSQHHILDDIERYNRDDCRSLQLLLAWLLQLRGDVPFYVKPNGQCHSEFVEGCNKCKKRLSDERELAHATELQRKLLTDVLPPATELEYRLMDGDRRARYLLANLLAYHRREKKPVWWQYYDRCENADALLEFDKDAIGGLALDASTDPVREKNSFLYTYSFPEQHHKLEAGDQVHDPAKRQHAGSIFDLDADKNRLRLKSTLSLDDAREIHAFIPGGPRDSDAQEASLAYLARLYLAGELAKRHPATAGLLLRRPPRTGAGVIQPEHVDSGSVSAVVRALAGDCLFVQGPPGTGKSTIGSEVICDLLRAGKRIGVTSNSHKAIHNLLHMVETCSQKRGDRFAGLYKHSDEHSEYRSEIRDGFITSTKDNAQLENAGYDLAGGTPWLFAREGLREKFDYLFIDEAGQMSLADAIAVSACAKNLVLLGDPVQLAQVSQGDHPLHAGNSVLQHLLGDKHTIPPDRGIFLNRSWRMHPEICSFISDMMYDGRLEAAENAEFHRVISPGLSGAGLRYIAVEHAGNSRSSSEEAEAIVREIELLLKGSLVDGTPPERSLTTADIIVVTPYNAQRQVISKRLAQAGFDVRVGTVDKFQGQEAAVVFYSLASSSGEDVPRSLAFAFEPNRFNVAVSRAKCLSAIVCSSRLLDAACKTPEQMSMVNLLCAYVERAGAAGVRRPAAA